MIRHRTAHPLIVASTTARPVRSWTQKDERPARCRPARRSNHRDTLKEIRGGCAREYNGSPHPVTISATSLSTRKEIER